MSPETDKKASLDFKFLRSNFKNTEIKNTLKDLIVSRLMIFVVQTTSVSLKVSDFSCLPDTVLPACGALQKEAGDISVTATGQCQLALTWCTDLLMLIHSLLNETTLKNESIKTCALKYFIRRGMF